MLKACLNGARAAGSHPRLPVSPKELAREAALAVAAGAEALHIHPRNAAGDQSLAPADIAAAVEAVRAACPGVPVGVTTVASAMPDVPERLALVRSWTTLPDFASVNMHEEGAAELAVLLIERGIGVEAGLSFEESTRLFVALPQASHCLRVLIEPHAREQDEALAIARTIVGVLDETGVTIPRLLHGFNATAWRLIDEASALGYDTRVGLEDTFTLPDGSEAADNAALVAAARARISAARR